MTDMATRAIDSEIADLQRIIDADEAILLHDKPAEERRRALVDEICSLQDQIERLRRRRLDGI